MFMLDKDCETDPTIAGYEIIIFNFQYYLDSYPDKTNLAVFKYLQENV